MIQRDTELGLVLPARFIPDGTMVSKITGHIEYAIRHKLVLYQNQDSGSTKPIEIEGTFLVGVRGNISQISPELMLIWRTTADDIVDFLQMEFSEDESC